MKQIARVDCYWEFSSNCLYSLNESASHRLWTCSLFICICQNNTQMSQEVFKREPRILHMRLRYFYIIWVTPLVSIVSLSTRFICLFLGHPQRLLLDLYSGLTPGWLRISCGMQEFEPGSGMCKANTVSRYIIALALSIIGLKIKIKILLSVSWFFPLVLLVVLRTTSGSVVRIIPNCTLETL